MKRCIRNMKNRFYCGIMPAVVGIATAGLIFQMLYFLPAIETSSTRMILQTSCVGFYVMCFISYYQAIRIKNSIPETIILPRKKCQLKNNHPLYSEKKKCEKQNQRYKPPRTSHCHACKCVSRMDHHCPYTDNCVGSKNLKSFILFCGFGGLFALQFFFLSIVFFSKLKAQQIPYELSEGLMFFWIFLFAASFLLSFSMNGLAISNLLLVSKNITQLDMLKGQFRYNDKHKNFPNPYDLGVLSNFNSVFNGDYWLFWWPTQTMSESDGTQFPMVQPVSHEDVMQLPTQVKQKLKDPLSVPVPPTIQDLRRQEQSKYEGVVFFYLGEQYKLRSEKQREEVQNIEEMVEEQGIRQKTQEELEILEGIYDQ